MANRPLRSNEALTVLPRHGEAGCVLLRCEVPPAVKDQVIDLAEERGVTVKEILNDAIRCYLEEAAA